MLEFCCYVYGKDIFEVFYKKDLVCWFLMGCSVSFDVERNMIIKLRDEVGLFLI